MKKSLRQAALMLSMATLMGLSTANAEVTVVPTTHVNNGDTYIMESMDNYDTKSGGALYQHTENTFNEQHLLETSIIKNWDPVWEESLPKSRYDYEYDAEGRITKSIAYNNAAEDPVNDEPVWSIYNYYTYTYDETGKLILKENTRNSNGEFFVTEHREYVYDEEGRLATETVSSAWSPTAELAVNSQIFYTEYDEYGRNTKYEQNGLYNGEVYSTTYYENIYDENGNLTNNVSYKKNENEELVKQNEVILVYTEDNQVMVEFYYKADNYTGQWGPFYRWDYTYDETNKYPVEKTYHVYSIDYTSESTYNTYEYNWVLVESSAVKNMTMDSELAINVVNDEVVVNYPGQMSGIAIYDMNGCALRTLSGAIANNVRLNVAGIGEGCYVVVVKGDAGVKAQKVVL
ncbi:MAG: hypothetical protein ACI304_01635 [Lepagella sp.]